MVSWPNSIICGLRVISTAKCKVYDLRLAYHPLQGREALVSESAPDRSKRHKICPVGLSTGSEQAMAFSKVYVISFFVSPRFLCLMMCRAARITIIGLRV